MSLKNPAQSALDQLREGNRRFVEDVPRRPRAYKKRKQRAALVSGQAPFAVILGCSDSRVSPEIVFDQDVGELFVVRVAGNVAGSHEIGSVEFAATELGARLVVVLGHSHCGAVRATLGQLRGTGGETSRHLQSIVDQIRPALDALPAFDEGKDEIAREQIAIRANVRAATKRLGSLSNPLIHLARTDGLSIVGAEYSVETGRVDFFEGV